MSVVRVLLRKKKGRTLCMPSSASMWHLPPHVARTNAALILTAHTHGISLVGYTLFRILKRSPQRMLRNGDAADGKGALAKTRRFRHSRQSGAGGRRLTVMAASNRLAAAEVWQNSSEKNRGDRNRSEKSDGEENWQRGTSGDEHGGDNEARGMAARRMMARGIGGEETAARRMAARRMATRRMAARRMAARRMAAARMATRELAEPGGWQSSRRSS